MQNQKSRVSRRAAEQLYRCDTCICKVSFEGANNIKHPGKHTPFHTGTGWHACTTLLACSCCWTVMHQDCTACINCAP